jgi:transposase-like protein
MRKARAGFAYTSCRRWTEKEARAALAAQSTSGLSVRAFAQREGLDAQRLFRWRQRLAAPSTPIGFVEVEAQRRREPIEVILTSGRVLRVSESVDVGVIARLAEALEKDRPC